MFSKLLSWWSEPIWWALTPKEKVLKYPNPIYEHRVISGLSVGQLAKLEALLGEGGDLSISFCSSRANNLRMPSDPVDVIAAPPPALGSVPCLQIWSEEDGETQSVPLVSFAKSPRRDKKTGLYTVDIRIVVAIAYAKDLEKYRSGSQPRRELGMYRTSRKVRDAIDDALGLYSDEPNGKFVKMGECAAFKNSEKETQVPPAAETLKRPSLLETLKSHPDKPPALRLGLHP